MANHFTTKINDPYRMVPPHQENFPTQADHRLIVMAEEKWRAIEMAQRMYGQFADAEKLISEAEKILQYVLGG